MTTLREAAAKALEALELHAKQYPHMQKGYTVDAITALRAALAEPVQEPVAWLVTDCIGERYLCFSPPLDSDQVLPLYAAPPQRKPLTRKEALAIVDAQEAYRKTGLPMFYRDQAYNMIRAVERAHGVTP